MPRHRGHGTIHHYGVGKNQVHCHEQVASIAKAMAGEIYDNWAKNNVWYRLNPDREVYVNKAWGLLLEAARGLMTDMLTRESTPEILKTQIYDALVLDNGLRRGKRLQLQAQLQ